MRTQNRCKRPDDSLLKEGVQTGARSRLRETSERLHVLWLSWSIAVTFWCPDGHRSSQMVNVRTPSIQGLNFQPQCNPITLSIRTTLCAAPPTLAPVRDARLSELAQSIPATHPTFHVTGTTASPYLSHRGSAPSRSNSWPSPRPMRTLPAHIRPSETIIGLVPSYIARLALFWIRSESLRALGPRTSSMKSPCTPGAVDVIEKGGQFVQGRSWDSYVEHSTV